MTTISKNLRKLREKNTNLSQSDVSDILGISQNTYSTWESGNADVKSEFIPKIAEILKVDINDLFRDTSSAINITQNNSNNTDNSINGLVFVLNDKDAFEKILETLNLRNK